MKTYYLAYGSNLHPLRLTQRVASAVAIATVRIVGQRLAFNKLGSDGSAKCSLQAVPDSDASMWAVLYEMEAVDVASLDGYEGLGHGYDKLVIPVPHAGIELPVFTYMVAAAHTTATAPPYTWYRDVVVSGARYHGFPAHYIQTIANVPAVPDPDVVRSGVGARLLAATERYSRQVPADRRGIPETLLDWPLSDLG